MRLLDLFCGRWGWSKAFAARGWESYGIDLVRPAETPANCIFVQWDILFLNTVDDFKPDFICASSHGEEFSVHGMKHFHPNPKYPENGIKLFNHTRQLCETSSLPYVMENVRAAQQFVGNAVHHCGPFYLWGNAVPPLIPRDLWKGFGNMDKNAPRVKRNLRAAELAIIPIELANCVADYAERLLEQRTSSVTP